MVASVGADFVRRVSPIQSAVEYPVAEDGDEQARLLILGGACMSQLCKGFRVWQPGSEFISIILVFALGLLVIMVWHFSTTVLLTKWMVQTSCMPWGLAELKIYSQFPSFVHKFKAESFNWILE